MLDLEEINLQPDRNGSAKSLRNGRKRAIAHRAKLPKWKSQLKAYSSKHFDKANKLVKP